MWSGRPLAAEQKEVHSALTDLFAPGGDLNQTPPEVRAYFDDLAIVRTAKDYMSRQTDVTAGGHAVVVAAGPPGAGKTEALSTMALKGYRVIDQFAEPEPYWGANVNMHGLESMLALYGHTRNADWRDRALRIAETFINVRARSAKWWLNEHYAQDWTPLPDFNVDNPRDEFRPYGMTIGHLFEWSRLLLELESTFELPPSWLREAASGLYETAVKYGWAVDGREGFVYTVAWDGRPVIRDRPHWVTAEAISAAATWTNLTGDPRYANQLQTWTTYAQSHLVDLEHGSWHHLLDPHNRPSYTMWSGKPDTYHALQAILLPDLPVAESTARAIISAPNRT
jgi:sulfoquinovose isomerase